MLGQLLAFAENLIPPTTVRWTLRNSCAHFVLLNHDCFCQNVSLALILFT